MTATEARFGHSGGESLITSFLSRNVSSASKSDDVRVASGSLWFSSCWFEAPVDMCNSAGLISSPHTF